MYENESPLPININCTACSLTTGCAVAGRGSEDLAKTKLIVISDYPGAYETEFGWPQVPNDWVEQQRKKQKRIPNPPNSGAFIRNTLAQLFGLNTYTEVYFTNAFKCDPNHQGKAHKATATQLGKCTSEWAQREFAALDLHCPNAPILAAGTWGLKLVQLLYRDRAASGSVESLLRLPDLKAGSHPLVCTYNPASYARSHGRLETQVSVNRRTGLTEILSVQPLSDFIYLPENLYLADLAELGRYLPNS